MKIKIFIAALCSLVVISCNKEVSKSDIKTTNDSLSYAIGVQVGTGLQRDSLKMNSDLIKLAINDVLSGDSTKIALKKEDMEKLFVALNKQMQEKKMNEMKSKGFENQALGEKFLANNKNQAGVKVTASGLQYKITQEGKGATPTLESTVKVHYKGMLLNGKVFDSSYDRGQPVEFPLNGVIKGWGEGLQLMKVGGKATLYIPAHLAYGEQGAGGLIGANETLIFDVELLDIVKK